MTKKHDYKNGIINIDKSITPINLPDFNTKIAEIAYYKAENRGFDPGFELDDWLMAEDELLNLGSGKR